MKKYLLFLVVIETLLVSCTNRNDFQKLENRNDTSTVREMRRELLESFSSTKNAGHTYPEYFGGMYYLHDDSVVVLVKDDYRADIPEFLNNSSCVILKNCRYSLNELNAIMEVIDDCMVNASSLNPIADNVCLWGVSQQNNCVEILMYECTQSDIDEFRRVVIDSPTLSFKSCKNRGYNWNAISKTTRLFLIP